MKKALKTALFSTMSSYTYDFIFISAPLKLQNHASSTLWDKYMTFGTGISHRSCLLKIVSRFKTRVKLAPMCKISGDIFLFYLLHAKISRLVLPTHPGYFCLVPTRKNISSGPSSSSAVAPPLSSPQASQTLGS